jgi:hypothetical protein
MRGRATITLPRGDPAYVRSSPTRLRLRSPREWPRYEGPRAQLSRTSSCSARGRRDGSSPRPARRTRGRLSASGRRERRPSGPLFGNQLTARLTNECDDATTSQREAERGAALRMRFVPAR